MSWITGAFRTDFGKLEGQTTLDLMATAAEGALRDAGLKRSDIDGLLCGYSTTLPHLMLSTLFAEHFGLAPQYAHSVQLGGATAGAMVMLADMLAAGGRFSHILVVAGENRLTGQSRDDALQTLAQVGHIDYEVPLGTTVPSYYALLASRYMHAYGHSAADLAELAVLMRRHAGLTPGAQYREAISVADVLASRAIASPLHLLDCCPVSDGAAAVVISAQPRDGIPVKILGGGQAHLRQHVSLLDDISQTGASLSLARAQQAAGIDIRDVRLAAVYDSFTITLTMLLEELGLAPRGEAGAMARDGIFDIGGRLPLNPHGGLLSYGHSGVAGALAHLVELQLQMTGRASGRQVREPELAVLHVDGGVLSSHVSLFMGRGR